MTRRLPWLLVTLLLAAGCGGGDDSGSDASGRLTPVTDVASVADAFDRDKGHARLVLLLSPT